jgi:hypothetical protein
VYSLYATHAPGPNEPFPVPENTEIAKQAMANRIAQLSTSISVPGGALLERGRWLVDHGRYRDALVPLGRLVTRYRQSPAVPEARYLAHRAGLGEALELADVENVNRDRAAALADLDVIMRDPYDFGVCAAKLAKASVMWTQGASDQAAALIVDALREWHDQQSSQRQRQQTDLERDIADIRNLVFRPSGDGALSGWARTSFSRRSSVPFVIINPDVSVKFPHAETTRVSVYQSLPGADQVLFLNAEQRAVFVSIIVKLGGNGTQQPTAIQAKSSQSLDVLAFWRKFFPAEPQSGPVSGPRGLTFETYPIIRDIEFLNDERTKAIAHVSVASEYATVVLEKDQGVWKALRLVNGGIA